MVTIKGQYELADFREAQKLHAGAHRFATLAGYCFVGFMTLMAVASVFVAASGAMDWSLVIAPVLFLVGFALWKFALIPWLTARNFRQHKELGGPFEISLADEGLDFRNAYGNGHSSWDTFVKWKENENALLLYRSGAIYNLIPKRFVESDSDMEFVRAKLQQHAIPEAKGSGNPAMLIFVLLLIVIVIVISLVFYFAP